MTLAHKEGITEALFQKYSNKGYSEVSVYVSKQERFSETIEGRYLKEFTENPKEDAIKKAAEVTEKSMKDRSIRTRVRLSNI